jgi:hypothetical protein
MYPRLGPVDWARVTIGLGANTNNFTYGSWIKRGYDLPEHKDELGRYFKTTKSEWNITTSS